MVFLLSKGSLAYRRNTTSFNSMLYSETGGRRYDTMMQLDLEVILREVMMFAGNKDSVTVGSGKELGKERLESDIRVDGSGEGFGDQTLGKSANQTTRLNPRRGQQEMREPG